MFSKHVLATRVQKSKQTWFLEIELLSGFAPLNLEDLTNYKPVKKVEFDEKENIIAIYFNEMNQEEQCYDLTMVEKVQVKERKPAIAKVYDYYDQKDIFVTEYNVE